MGDVLLNHKRKAGGHRQSCIIAHRLYMQYELLGTQDFTATFCVLVKVLCSEQRRQDVHVECFFITPALEP